MLHFRAGVYNISFEKMLHYTKYMGRLYDYDDENIEILNEFIALLDSSKVNIQFEYLKFVNTLVSVQL